MPARLRAPHGARAARQARDEQLVRLRRDERRRSCSRAFDARRTASAPMKCPFCGHLETRSSTRAPSATGERHPPAPRVRGVRRGASPPTSASRSAAHGREEGRPARDVRSAEAHRRPAHRLQQAAGRRSSRSRPSPTPSSASCRIAAKERSVVDRVGEQVMAHLRDARRGRVRALRQRLPLLPGHRRVPRRARQAREGPRSAR